MDILNEIQWFMALLSQTQWCNGPSPQDIMIWPPFSARYNDVMAILNKMQWCDNACQQDTIMLTDWGRVTHICVGKLTIIGSDNGLSPGRRQAIIWTSAGILLIGPLWTNFSEIFIRMRIFSFKKMHLKMSSAKCRPFCVGLNVLRALSTHTLM